MNGPKGILRIRLSYFLLWVAAGVSRFTVEFQGLYFVAISHCWKKIKFVSVTGMFATIFILYYLANDYQIRASVRSFSNPTL
jgi:hypothetical protein